MTDPLSILFIVCFLAGLVFFVVTAMLGQLGHGLSHGASHHMPALPHGNTHIAHSTQAGHTSAADHGQHNTQQAAKAVAHDSSLLPFFNPTALMLFLIGFGFFGYLFHNIVQLALPLLSLLLAAIGGIVIAALVLSLITRMFGDSEANTEQDVSDLTGLLGKDSITIQENGIGEILYTSPGGMRKSVPARSIDGRRIERDQEVVVVNYQHGVAQVDTWEHFITAEGHYPDSNVADELEKLRSLLNETGKSEPMVIRNDSQKE